MTTKIKKLIVTALDAPRSTHQVWRYNPSPSCLYFIQTNSVL